MRRARLELFLRRNAKDKNVAKVLANPELFNMLDSMVARETSGRPIIDFLKWLNEHRDEIMALIRLLVK